MYSSTKQLAQLADIEVPVDRIPRAHLEMVHAQFSFAQFKTAFNRPTRKCHPQQPLQRYTAGADHHIGQEVFDLIRLENIACYHQGMSPTRQALGAMLAIKTGILDFPDNRSFFSILDTKPLPFFPRSARVGCNRICGSCSHPTKEQGTSPI